MYAFAFLAWPGTLTLRQVVTEIPHDLAALVVYLMFAAFIGLTWLGSRPSVVARYAGSGGVSPAETDAVGAPEGPAAEEPEPEPAPAAARRPARRRPRRARSAERITWVG